jgi:hypothetical protein
MYGGRCHQGSCGGASVGVCLCSPRLGLPTTPWRCSAFVVGRVVVGDVGVQAKAAHPDLCVLYREDYLECLHRKKLVRPPAWRALPGVHLPSWATPRYPTCPLALLAAVCAVMRLCPVVCVCACVCVCAGVCVRIRGSVCARSRERVCVMAEVRATFPCRAELVPHLGLPRCICHPLPCYPVCATVRARAWP